MKKRALRKDFYMEIRRSMGRFLSIFFIVAIGCAFFSGIRASEPDMRYSGDAYFDEKNMMDIEVISTLGLTDDDLQAMRDFLKSLEEEQQQGETKAFSKRSEDRKSQVTKEEDPEEIKTASGETSYGQEEEEPEQEEVEDTKPFQWPSEGCRSEVCENQNEKEHVSGQQPVCP